LWRRPRPKLGCGAKEIRKKNDECENWSLALTEEHILKAFQNRVIRRIFAYETKEVAGQWIKLHSQDHQIYYGGHIRRLSGLGHTSNTRGR
jgi:hypothetical protein